MHTTANARSGIPAGSRMVHAGERCACFPALLVGINAFSGAEEAPSVKNNVRNQAYGIVISRQARLLRTDQDPDGIGVHELEYLLIPGPAFVGATLGCVGDHAKMLMGDARAT